MATHALILPLVSFLLAGASEPPTERRLETLEDVQAELERLKAESAPQAEVLVHIQAYENWRHSPWRGGRFGVDPLPVQNLTESGSTDRPNEM
nr:hypothetical protein [Nitrosomonas nitrosa]